VTLARSTLLAWPSVLTDNLIEVFTPTGKMDAWRLLVMSVLGVALLVVGLILGLGEGQRPTLGAILFAVVGICGIVAGVQGLKKLQSPPPPPPGRMRLLLSGVGFGLVGIYALVIGVGEIRDGSIASGLISLAVALGSLALGCVGVLGGLGVPLPSRHSSHE
jgi:hypothetical protein